MALYIYCYCSMYRYSTVFYVIRLYVLYTIWQQGVDDESRNSNKIKVPSYHLYIDICHLYDISCFYWLK